MAFQGNLQDIALPDILQLLAAQGLSGVLKLCRGDEEVRIGIADGMAVDANSNLRPLARSLARKLVRSGALSRAELERAGQLQRAGDRGLSEVITSEGMVPAADVRKALTLEFLELVYGVLRWEDGSYDFERRDIEYDAEKIQPASFQSILMDGMRMIDEWSLVEGALGNRTTVLSRIAAADDAPPAELSEVEATVHGQVDGRSSIQQIVDKTVALEFDVCRALYDLQKRGLIGPAYEGTLEDVPFPELVLALRRTRATGQLEVRRHDTVRTVTFRDGHFVMAVSNDPDDGIGPHLLATGAISRTVLDAARSVVPDPEEVGDDLVRSGALPPELLQRYRGELMEGVIHSLFHWTDGIYRYRPGVPDGVRSFGLEAKTALIVLKGVRSIDRWSRIESAVGPAETMYRYTADGLPDTWVGLPDDYQAVLELFRDGLKLGDAITRIEAPEFFCYQLVWAWKVLDLLETEHLPRGARLLISALSGQASEAPVEDDDEFMVDDDLAALLNPSELAPDDEPIAPRAAAAPAGFGVSVAPARRAMPPVASIPEPDVTSTALPRLDLPPMLPPIQMPPDTAQPSNRAPAKVPEPEPEPTGVE